MFDFRVGLGDIFYMIPLTIFDQLHFRSDMRRHDEVYMLWVGRFSFPSPMVESTTKVHWHDTILVNGDNYVRLQEWRM
jgi:hypothetical protein